MKWISVEEMLPEKTGRYIVVFKNNHMWYPSCKIVKWQAHMRDGKFIKNKWVCGNIPKACWITHWMPVPEYPKFPGIEISRERKDG